MVKVRVFGFLEGKRHHKLICIITYMVPIYAPDEAIPYGCCSCFSQDHLEIGSKIVWTYSKALRCTFFGERKNSCSSKFVQLFLLNKAESKMIKKSCCSRFYYINSFSSSFFGPNSNSCTCKVRAAWGRVSRGLTVAAFVHSWAINISKGHAWEHSFNDIISQGELYWTVRYHLFTSHGTSLAIRIGIEYFLIRFVLFFDRLETVCNRRHYLWKSLINFLLKCYIAIIRSWSIPFKGKISFSKPCKHYTQVLHLTRILGLEKNMFRKIHDSRTVWGTLLMQKSPTWVYISQKPGQWDPR